jgi:hypothetical protein
MKYLVFLVYSFWVPQIVYCARHDARQPLRPVYVIGITLTRLALPLYMFGCPRNILHVAPQPWVCAGLCASMGLQVMISCLCIFSCQVQYSACDAPALDLRGTVCQLAMQVIGGFLPRSSEESSGEFCDPRHARVVLDKMMSDRRISAAVLTSLLCSYMLQQHTYA